MSNLDIRLNQTNYNIKIMQSKFIETNKYTK